jgi:hypothetical protein
MWYNLVMWIYLSSDMTLDEMHAALDSLTPEKRERGDAIYFFGHNPASAGVLQPGITLTPYGAEGAPPLVLRGYKAESE